MRGIENPPYYLDAYGIACKLGFKGSKEKWIASLKGEKGDPVLWKGQYDTLSALQAAHPTGSEGDCYLYCHHDRRQLLLLHRLQRRGRDIICGQGTV